MSKSKKTFFKAAAGIILLSLVVGGGVFYYFYQQVFKPNVTANNGEKHELFIPTGAGYDEVKKLLKENNIVKDINAFDWVAHKMNYPNKIYPGRYLIRPKMNSRKLIQMLRSGKQVPFDVVINNIRTKDQLVGLVGSTLERDSIDLAGLLSSKGYLSEKGFTPDNVASMFISDTYKFNWNTSAEQFVDRMHGEYQKFWTDKRKSKAKEKNLSPLEVITLASIVEEETKKTDEMDDVAGVYINRLRSDWPLQADPTLKFAIGDFTITRILEKDTHIDSPYNTYKHLGLPPGPIRIPSKKALEATLNATDHKYMFFCAKEDFSGYHNFAVTLAEHNINARKYQRELNKRKIMR